MRSTSKYSIKGVHSKHVGVKPKVLFISHEAGLYGASRSLLDIVRFLGKSGKWDMMIIVRECCGPIMNDFTKCARTLNYHAEITPPRWSDLRDMWWKASLRQTAQWLMNRFRQMKIQWTVKRWNPDVIYSNTAMNGDVIEAMRLRSTLVIVHVRELGCYLNQLTGVRLKSLLDTPKMYVANSETVKRYLQDTYDIQPQRVAVVSPSIDTAVIDEKLLAANPVELRSRMAISERSVVVGSVGDISIRKGWDLFLDLAELVLANKAANAPDVRFIWVGGGDDMSAMKTRIEKCSLDKVVQLVGPQENPYPFIQLFDVLALCSREEPFGRVLMEAGWLRKPSVAFAMAGGPKEFITPDCGILVDELDVNRMATAIMLLASDRELRQRLGRQAHEKVAKKYTAEIVARRVSVIMEAVARGDSVTTVVERVEHDSFREPIREVS